MSHGRFDMIYPYNGEFRNYWMGADSIVWGLSGAFQGVQSEARGTGDESH